MHFVIYEKDSIRIVTISNPLFYIDSNDIKKRAIELDLLRIVLSLEYFVYNIAFFSMDLFILNMFISIDLCIWAVYLLTNKQYNTKIMAIWCRRPSVISKRRIFTSGVNEFFFLNNAKYTTYHYLYYVMSSGNNPKDS